MKPTKLMLFENYGEKEISKYIIRIGLEPWYDYEWRFKIDAFERGSKYYILLGAPNNESPILVRCIGVTPKEALFVMENDHGCQVSVGPLEIFTQTVKIVKAQEEKDVMENKFAKCVITETYKFVDLEPEHLYIIAIRKDLPNQEFFAEIVGRSLSCIDGAIHSINDSTVHFAIKRTFKSKYNYDETFKVTAKEVCNGGVEIRKALDICDFSKLDSLPSAYDMNPKGELICRCCGEVLERNEKGKE